MPSPYWTVSRQPDLQWGKKESRKSRKSKMPRKGKYAFASARRVFWKRRSNCRCYATLRYSLSFTTRVRSEWLIMPATRTLTSGKFLPKQTPGSSSATKTTVESEVALTTWTTSLLPKLGQREWSHFSKHRLPIKRPLRASLRTEMTGSMFTPTTLQDLRLKAIWKPQS